MLGEFGDLSCLHDMIPALFDPVVDVREEGRKAMEAVLKRAVETSLGESLRRNEETEEAMWLFARLSSVSQRNVRTIMVTSLMTLSADHKETFWDLFASMESQARSAVEHEILSRPNMQRVQLLYHGLVSGNPATTERALSLIDRLINKDTIGDHGESLVRLPAKQRSEAMELLSEKGLLSTFFEYLPWIRRDLKVAFIKLFQYDTGERYIKNLLSLLDDPNPQMAAAVVEDFLTLQKELPEAGLQKLLKSPFPPMRRAGIQYLQYRGQQQSVKALMPLLKDGDIGIVRAATKAISRISRDFLIDHFSSIDAVERRSLAQLMSRIDPGFAEGLTELLGSLDEEDRLHLIQILADLADHPSAGQALSDLILDANDKVRATAVRGLEKMDASQLSDEAIEKLFADPNPRVRANLIESLPPGKKRSWLEQIEAAARSAVPRERANAVMALYELGQGDAEIPLMQMLRHPDSWMRTSGLWVLGRVEAPHLIYKAMELCEDPNPHVQVHALRAVGKKGTADMIRELSPYLNSPHFDVREAAQVAVRTRLGAERQ
jgi:HEAT repeat protein